MNLFKYSTNNNRYHTLEENDAYLLEINNFSFDELKELVKNNIIINLHIIIEPNYINAELLKYLNTLKQKIDLTIELKAPLIYNMDTIALKYDWDQIGKIIKKIRQLKIKVVINVINGLPNITKEIMLKNTRYLTKLDIQGVKINMFTIEKNTKISEFYTRKAFPLLTKKEYIDIVTEQLEIIPSRIVIYQLINDINIKNILVPKWLMEKNNIENEINTNLISKNTYQGFHENILNKFKQIIVNNINNNDIVIDATIGNGNDTMFLTNLVTNGHVYGFDIQKEAIIRTKKLLNNNKIKNYTLYQESHANMLDKLPQLKNKVKIITFNLGYLPNWHKEITTKVEATIKAIKISLELLKKDGICLIVVYPGHEEGQKESKEIKKCLAKMGNNYIINYYYNTDNKKAPYLIEIKNI
ncbi:MAG: class I SAM-dependent methyltransferase [Bacilli bacterium]|nr:class I SAM-dependent methyltransferase [Bacilli bacterium]